MEAHFVFEFALQFLASDVICQGHSKGRCVWGGGGGGVGGVGGGKFQTYIKL